MYGEGWILMSSVAILGRAVLNDIILEDAAVIVENNIIKYAGKKDAAKLPHKVIDVGDKLIAPGFVDIHCHAGGNYYAYENAVEMAKYHLAHGTTAMLCTLYRDLNHQHTITALNDIKTAMKIMPNIIGAHMEGPYLNPKYGAKTGIAEKVDKSKYQDIINTGIVKQWTVSPEMPNTTDFIKDIVKSGIVPAIGHSEASFEQVNNAVQNKAKIVTHLTNATGYSINPTRYGGTKEVSFDDAVMLCDNLYYELICDKMGVHIRPEIIKLIIKTVGIDKIIGITDCCKGSYDDSDINIVNGELMGSKMTMDKVARNFFILGLSLTDVFKVVSYNPAKAINMKNVIGSLKAGNRADIIIVNDKLNEIEVLNLN